MEKPKVFNIQGSLKRETKREITPSMELIKDKSLRINTPTILALKRDKRVFFEYRARTIARREGIRDKIVSSIGLTFRTQ